MDDEFPATSMQHPTAGYFFAEELEVHVMALDDAFHSYLEGCLDPTTTASCFSDLACPGSPSSVVYLPPFYPPSPFKTTTLDSSFIKPEPLEFVPTYTTSIYSQPLPGDVSPTDDQERLRRRQRGYEKRYRGRKRVSTVRPSVLIFSYTNPINQPTDCALCIHSQRDLQQQRDAWLALEMKLDATRKKHCSPYIHTERVPTSLRSRMLLLLQEERALQEDRVAMKTLQAWEQVSRIREYSDKEELRTVSEWRHSAEKVVGQCALLGPRRFHPYAPLTQHFTW